MLDSRTAELKFMQTAPQPNYVIRFGVFEADLRSGELRKSGVRIKLQELPFRALRILVTHPGEVLSREQFRQELWPDGVFVDFNHGISSAINRLRDALGDSAENPMFIETVERRGYRWIAPTHLPEPTPEVRGPVLIKPRVEEASESKPELLALPERPIRHWRWSLVFPLAAVCLAIWVVWPSYRAAKAGSRKSPALEARIPAGSTNSDAEHFYLQGRFYWQERTPDGLNKAVDAFTQAIIRDPNYAPAYVGLANSYNLLREYTVMPANEAYPRALAAAQRAVELDDQSSEAHASLAFVLFNGMWDVSNADREFRRALALDPNNAVAHHWYATYLATVGRHAESLAEIDRAQTLDPSSKAILADKGDLLFVAGRQQDALELLKQLEASEPDFISPHRYLRVIYFANGDYANFLEEWKKEALLMRDALGLKLVEAGEEGLDKGGEQGMLFSIRGVEKRLYQRGSVSAYSMAQTDALLGDKKDALQYLKIAFDDHDESVIQLKIDPELSNLRQEPAYNDLVARVGLRGKN
ncbi:MAG TPA: tetratricopeptide repeat protein [Verrucomicrobiae bacterium]|nr:tetratricopeptide repeat protein [Verrucomicrobiae bacterium]